MDGRDQIEQNVAAVERMSAGVEIDVEPLAIAGAQECNGWRRGKQIMSFQSLDIQLIFSER